MNTGSLLVVKSGRGVTLTSHPLRVPWSWKGIAIPLLPLWAVRSVQSFGACTRVHFTFYMLCPLNWCPRHGSPVPFIEFQTAPRLRHLTSAGSKKRTPINVCVSCSKDSHSHKTSAEVFFSAPHYLHKGLSISTIRYTDLSQSTMTDLLYNFGTCPPDYTASHTWRRKTSPWKPWQPQIQQGQRVFENMILGIVEVTQTPP